MSRGGGRILAIDLGEARIGLALSDELGITAQPAGVLSCGRSGDELLAIRKLVEDRGISRLVIGYPLRLSGEEGSRARAARDTAEKLRAALPGVGVDLWDERLTTAQAERAMIADGVRRKRRRQVIDEMAAVLILQSWLEAHAVDEER